MKKSLIFLAFLLFLGIIAAFLPYRAWLEKRLELILEAKGFENVALTISSLGLNSASLENVSIGSESQLNLKNILFEYSPFDLWNGNLRDLAVSGVSLDVRQNNGIWVVSGLEGWSKKPESNISEPLAVPITPEQLARIPFERIKLEDSLLNITMDKNKVSLPLNLTWQKSPKSEFIYQGNNLDFRFNNIEVAADTLSIEASIDQEGKKWAGAWALQNITTKAASISVPVMNGGGTVLIDGEHARVEGKIGSADQSWQMQFNTYYNFVAAEKSDFTILQAGMPWKEGRIKVRNVKIPFESKNSVKIVLQIQSVSMQELMQSLTGDRISATGKVSGTLPIIIGRDGSIQVLQGNLKSDAPGTISMPPEVIPGDNEQVSLVRQILEDLRYSGLTIEVQNKQNGQLGVLMSFEGNNPAVYEGRPVKLNVNLTGDVLDFIQKNILLLTNPEQFLQQGHDEKN